VSIRWEAAGGSDVGRVRRGNEDAFLLDAPRGIFLVADGMGGHAAGEVASDIARETVGTLLSRALDAGAGEDDLPSVMDEAVRAAHAGILAYAARYPGARGLGTTLTAAVLSPGGELLLGHVGDSRAYLLRDGGLVQLTRDHTWVQREVDAGRLTATAARAHPLSHIITRALGADSGERPDLLHETLGPGDVLLLCTDGLTGMVEDGELARILGSGLPVPARVEALIAAANQNGGDDNVTAVVVEVS
jgi:serine/threonine protein phosphatase PrpC